MASHGDAGAAPVRADASDRDTPPVPGPTAVHRRFAWRRPAGNGWFVRSLIVVVLMQIGLTIVRPMVSYRALALGAGAAEIGWITASFALLSLAIALPAGRWIDRFGEARFAVAGSAVMAIVGVGLAMAESVLALCVAMTALGAGQIMVALSLQTLVANGGSPDKRDERFSTHTVLASLGRLIGPAVAGLVVIWAIGAEEVPPGTVPLRATDAVFVVSAAIATVATLVALTLWRWPPREHATATLDASATADSTRAAMRRVVRVPSIFESMLASVAVLCCLDIILAYLPVYGTEHGIPVQIVGLLLAVNGAAQVASRLTMPRLRRLLGRRRLLVLSLLLPAVTLALLPPAGDLVPLLFGLLAITGFWLGIGQPLTIAWVASQTPIDIRATALGLRLSANRAGQFALPAVAGAVAGAAGMTAVFWSLAGLLGVSAALVARASFETPVAAAAERSAAGTPAASPARSQVPAGSPAGPVPAVPGELRPQQAHARPGPDGR